MVHLRNRKMPSIGTAYCYLALATLFALLYGLRPTALIFVILAIGFSAVGLLSIPRISYLRVLLYALLSGLIAAGGSFLLTQSPAFALAAFAFAPATALFTLTVRRRNSRSAGIVWITLSLAVFLAGAALLWLYQRAGSLSATVFVQLYKDVKAGFINYLTPMLQENSDALFLTGLDLETLLPTLYKQLVSLIPGFYLMILWLVAWLSTVLLRLLFKSYVYGHDRFAIWPVTVWKPIAWIYFAAIFLTLLPFGGFYSIVATVANNLYLVLLPAFTVVGCTLFKARITRLPGCGCMSGLLIGFMLFINPALPLMMLSLSGASMVAFPQKTPPPVDPPKENPPTQGDDPQ